MFPKVRICNQLDVPLYLGIRGRRNRSGIWLAPAGETGDCYTFYGLDVNDRRVRELLKNYAYRREPAWITVELVESLPEYLGSTTTTTSTTPSP